VSVIGVGIDLIEIDRITRALERRPRFTERCFTTREAAYCQSRAFPAQHFAARFAAKEAVGKALGIGMTRWREVEVVRHGGPPSVALTGRYAQRAEDLGVTQITISLTHSRDTAAAVAIVEGAGRHTHEVLAPSS
jgi:holo-[acyl-carrier protein] synthase